MLPLDTEPGTEANKNCGHRRAHLVRAVRILPFFMFAFDGATTLAMTGVSLRSKAADPFTSVSTDDMGCFLQVCVMRRGHRLTDVAEMISPGCSRPSHRDHWLVEYLVGINSHAHNTELQAITREPKHAQAIV